MKVKYIVDKTELPEKSIRVRENQPEDKDKNKTRIMVKTLKVVDCPQDGSYVPSIRVAGKWLEDYGFKTGDKVTIAAINNLIVIKKGDF